MHKNEVLIKELDISKDVIAEEKMDMGVVCLKAITQEDEDIIVYSAGIGNQIDFELDLIKRIKELGKKIHLYAFDPTPKCIEFIEKSELPLEFTFYPYAISSESGIIEFALPRTEGWVSGSAANVKNDERNMDFNNKIKVEARSIKDIMAALGHSKIHLLKLDIEGSEFEVIENILKNKIEIGQMCVDYHDHMFDKGDILIKKMRKNLKKSGYKIFYVEEDSGKCKTFSCIKCK